MLAQDSTVSEDKSLLDKKKILVVDDEKNIRLTVQHSLLSADFAVDTASDGQEGLDRFRTEHYDLILMDLRMPNINGMEMLKQIREIDKSTAAVVITAYLTIETLLEAFRLGVSDFIRKPFSPSEVRETVRRVLGRPSITAPATFDAQTSLELARRALSAGDLREAIADTKSAIAMHADDADSHALLGILEHLRGNPEAAEKAFQEALLIEPQHQLSRDYLIWAQSKARRPV